MFTELENWMFPPAPNHLDAPRASIRAVATPVPERAGCNLHRLKIEFIIRRPRTGDRKKSLSNLVDLTVRAAHEKELFPPNDWEFIEWVTENFAADAGKAGAASFTNGVAVYQGAQTGLMAGASVGLDYMRYEALKP